MFLDCRMLNEGKLIVRVYNVMKESVALAQTSCSYILAFWVLVYKYFMFVWTSELEHNTCTVYLLVITLEILREDGQGKVKTTGKVTVAWEKAASIGIEAGEDHSKKRQLSSWRRYISIRSWTIWPSRHSVRPFLKLFQNQDYRRSIIWMMFKKIGSYLIWKLLDWVPINEKAEQTTGISWDGEHMTVHGT